MKIAENAKALESLVKLAKASMEAYVNGIDEIFIETDTGDSIRLPLNGFTTVHLTAVNMENEEVGTVSFRF